MNHLTDDEREELESLRHYDQLCSMGDRPQSPSVAKLRRLMELESRAQREREERKP